MTDLRELYRSWASGTPFSDIRLLAWLPGTMIGTDARRTVADWVACLWAALHADKEDLGAYLIHPSRWVDLAELTVQADALQAAGDERGEWFALYLSGVEPDEQARTAIAARMRRLIAEQRAPMIRASNELPWERPTRFGSTVEGETSRWLYWDGKK